MKNLVEGGADMFEKELEGGFDPFENPDFKDPKWNQKATAKYEKDIINLMDMIDKEEKKKRKTGKILENVKDITKVDLEKHPEFKETFDVEGNFEK